MRAGLVGILIWGSGCGTITTQMTRRVALSTLPSAPAALSGGSGVGLKTAMVVGSQEATGDGTAFPMFQPELGATVQIAKRSYVGGRVSLASTAFGARSPTGLPLPSDAFAMELALGGGHDLPFTPSFGVSFSGELGFSMVSLTTEATTTETHTETLPVGRVALGLYGTPGPFRIYGGAAVSTTTTNAATSVRTTNCMSLPSCTVSESGNLGVEAAGVIGGGLRWQPHPLVSIALEGWVPFSQPGTRTPFVATLALRVGDFTFDRRAPKPPPGPPPPTPPAEPEAGQVPVQL